MEENNWNFDRLLKAARAQLEIEKKINPSQSRALPSSPPSAVVQPFSEQADLEKLKKQQELSQQDIRFASEMEQRRIDRELKKSIATLVFRFLAVETFALFLIVLLQGFRPFNFHLEDSTINIFLGATLLQISSMAVIITRHLYPTSGQQ